MIRLRAEMMQGSNSFWGKVLCFSENIPDRLWDPTSTLFNGYQVTFQLVKRLRDGVKRSSPSSAEIRNEWI